MIPPMRALAPLVALALMGLFLYLELERFLIDRQPLEEINVTVTKKPEFTFQQHYCNNKYGDVTQAGPHLKCLRTDI